LDVWIFFCYHKFTTTMREKKIYTRMLPSVFRITSSHTHKYTHTHTREYIYFFSISIPIYVYISCQCIGILPAHAESEQSPLFAHIAAAISPKSNDVSTSLIRFPEWNLWSSDNFSFPITIVRNFDFEKSLNENRIWNRLLLFSDALYYGLFVSPYILFVFLKHIGGRSVTL